MTERENPPPSPSTGGQQGSRILLVFGFVALALGAWLLLDSMGIQVPGLSQHWPLFVVLGGLGSLLDYFKISRRPAAFGFAVLGVGLGILFYCLSLGLTGVAAVRDWGPGLPLVLGLVFLGVWFTSSVKNSTHLALGLVGIVLSVTGWGWHLVRLEVLWALLLLAVGGLLVWRAVARR